MNHISVVIPIYNAESSLDRCIQSIVSQTYTNIELILVNDGSTDNSLGICNNYATTDPRIVVISQKNSGVSSARNRGIETARNEWITFIDADDYIDNKYIESLAQCANHTNHNTLIIQGHKKISKGELADKVVFPNILLQGTELQSVFEKHKIIEYGQPWAKLYNRNLLIEKNIRFNKQISYSEDMLFMLEYILHCNSIKYIEGAYYNYIVDTSILSQRYNSFESEYNLFLSYISLINQISTKFSFKIPQNTLLNGGLILMRCLYTMYINKYDRNTRMTNIKQIRKRHKQFIKEYYKPKLSLFKIVKSILLLNPVLFDIICKVKFK